MIRISLTDFVDFVSSSGTPKLTKVKKAKKQDETPYAPFKDFWKTLRDGIVEYHKSGGSDKSKLDNIMTRVRGKNKLARYPECIRAYKRFLGRKKFVWFDPPSDLKEIGGIQIRVNPEMGLRLGKNSHVIKLYFKQEKLSLRKVEIIRLLMQDAFAADTPNVNFAVLDVPRGRLISDRPINQDVLPLLEGEATNFKTIWERI